MTGTPRGTRRAAAAAFCALAMLLCLPALASANTWFVSTSGSDMNDCMSAITACATIGQAVADEEAASTSADTISIGPGTFDDDAGVSTSNPITFLGNGASGPDATVIDSTGQAFDLSGQETLSDLDVEDTIPTGVAVSVNGAGAVSVQDATIDSTGGGSDAIGASGASLSVTGSALNVVNTDANVENNAQGTGGLNVNDGSGIELGAGTLMVDHSTITVSEGIALRTRHTATSATVRDSVLESTGAVPAGYAGSNTNQWQTVTDGAGTIALDFDTIVNETVGMRNTNQTQSLGVFPPTSDALWVAPVSGNGVTIADSVLHAQPTTAAPTDGVDIGANEDVTATDSAYTTVSAANGATVTAPGTAGNLAGDPGFNDEAGGDFTLGRGSALLGAADAGDATLGELDLDGDARTTSCGASTIANIGAYESGVPACPAPPATGDTTGALTSGSCLTGAMNPDGCATGGVPGLTGGDPQGFVESPDGRFAYAVAEDTTGNGVDVVELARGANGALTPLPVPNNCLSAETTQESGCGTGNVAELQGPNEGQPSSIAMSPDGSFVYVDNGSTIGEFTRDPNSGVLTPIGPADCIAGPGGDPSCSQSDQEQVFSASALQVSPDNGQLYLVTADECLIAEGGVRPRAGGADNAPCTQMPPEFLAQADIAVFEITSPSGVLTVGPCYAAVGPVGDCTSLGSDQLYAMTSIAFSPDGADVYVTGDGPPGQTGFGLVPGEIDEFSRDAPSGALTPLPDAGACLTAGPATCGGTGSVAGLLDPQQIVISPDGHEAYVSSDQYLAEVPNTSDFPTVDSGILADSTITEFSRDTASGALSALPDGSCFAGFEQGCRSATGTGQIAVQLPGLTGAEGLAISPDGDNVYASANVAGTDTDVAEFSRDAADGTLTPLSSPNTCIGNGTPPGASGALNCGVDDLAGVLGSIAPQPGGLLVSPDCDSVYLLSDAIVGLDRTVPAGATGCATPAGPSAVSLSTSQLTFGVANPAVLVGSTSAAQSVTLTNSGTGPLTISAVRLAGVTPGSFAITSDGCTDQTLPAGGGCTVSVTFTPAAAGVVGAALQFGDSAGDSPQSVTLTGDGSGLAVTVAPASLTFADEAVGATSDAQTVTITNTGRLGTVTTPSPTLTGPGAASFLINSDDCPASGLAVGASCSIGIEFKAPAIGQFTAALALADNAPGAPQTVALSGTGAATNVTGAVYSSSTLLPDVTIYACPSNAIETGQCVSTTTDASGDYGLVLAPGSWLLQVFPSQTGIIGTTATIVVTRGTPVTQNFGLSAPVGLADGLTFNGQDSGVPTVYYKSPYTMQAPVPIPPNGPANTTMVFLAFAGLQGGQQSADASQEFIQMGGLLFGVRYGASGTPAAISDPYVGTVPCQNSTAATAQCATLASIASAPASASASASRRGGPVAHESQSSTPGISLPACPAGVGGSAAPAGDGQVVSPGDSFAGTPTVVNIGGQNLSIAAPTGVQSFQLATYQQVQAAGLVGSAPPPLVQPSTIAPGGIVVNVTLDNGVSIPIEFAQAQIPSVSLSNPFANVVANGAITGVNAGLNKVPQINQYNSVVSSLNGLATAAQSPTQLNVASAAWTIVSNGADGEFHGTGAVYWNVMGGADKFLLSASAPTATSIPVHYCIGADGNVYVDPSGEIRTTRGAPVSGATVTLKRTSRTGGPLRAVPTGSAVMSPSNRRNPSISNELGDYGWDVVPGQYAIATRRHGCTVPGRRHSKTVTSRRLGVPPAATGVNLTLSCPSLRRSAVRMAITVRRAKSSVGSDQAVVTLRGRHGAPVGAVTFTLRGKVDREAAVAKGRALLAVPAYLVGKGTLVARYGGDATYKPARARARF
ncbi:MAG TPA: choice-of-anchor D domain-containing protein [Solirubrobacteraceae bacterium]|nr:choice-of-anchor D domain-containing protein [Solirubrobacteraceae bacterium]